MEVVLGLIMIAVGIAGVVIAGVAALCIGGIVRGLLFGFPVMYLWNYVLVDVFPSVHSLTFWQSVGLVMLSAFLVVPTNFTKGESKSAKPTK